MLQALKSDFDVKNHPELSPAKLHELSAEAYKALNTIWPEVRELWLCVNVE